MVSHDLNLALGSPIQACQLTMIEKTNAGMRQRKAVMLSMEPHMMSMTMVRARLSAARGLTAMQIFGRVGCCDTTTVFYIEGGREGGNGRK